MTVLEVFRKLIGNLRAETATRNVMLKHGISNVNSFKDLMPEVIESDDCPRYPPFAKGLPVASTDAILQSQYDQIVRIRNGLKIGFEGFDKLVMPILIKYAEYIHLLPASESHHHRGAGGLFRHSLEVGFHAALMAGDVEFGTPGDPKDRRMGVPRWQLAVFFAGLFHDAGKPLVDLVVTDRAGKETWDPESEPLSRWASRIGIDRYFLRWNKQRVHKNHEEHSVKLTHALFYENKAVIEYFNELKTVRVYSQMTESLNGQLIKSPMRSLVDKADSYSVEKDLKLYPAMNASEESTGTPVVRYVFNAMRDLINGGASRWRVNEPGSVIWLTPDGLFVAWEQGYEDIKDHIKKQKTPGIPFEADTAAQILIEHDHAIAKEDSEEVGKVVKYKYWLLGLEINTKNNQRAKLKLKCLRIRSVDALFKLEPPAVYPGVILESNKNTVKKIEPTISADEVKDTETSQVLADHQLPQEIIASNDDIPNDQMNEISFDLAMRPTSFHSSPETDGLSFGFTNDDDSSGNMNGESIPFSDGVINTHDSTSTQSDESEPVQLKELNDANNEAIAALAKFNESQDDGLEFLFNMMGEERPTTDLGHDVEATSITNNKTDHDAAVVTESSAVAESQLINNQPPINSQKAQKSTKLSAISPSKNKPKIIDSPKVNELNTELEKYPNNVRNILNTFISPVLKGDKLLGEELFIVKSLRKVGIYPEAIQGNYKLPEVLSALSEANALEADPVNGGKVREFSGIRLIVLNKSITKPLLAALKAIEQSVAPVHENRIDQEKAIVSSQTKQNKESQQAETKVIKTHLASDQINSSKTKDMTPNPKHDVAVIHQNTGQHVKGVEKQISSVKTGKIVLPSPEKQEQFAKAIQVLEPPITVSAVCSQLAEMIKVGRGEWISLPVERRAVEDKFVNSVSMEILSQLVIRFPHISITKLRMHLAKNESGIKLNLQMSTLDVVVK